jgi:hypothetical protein
MKRTHPTRLLAALLSLPLLAVANADGDALKARLVDDGNPEAAEVRKVGEDAINRLATTLVREVTAAMAKEGPAGAVDTCHLKAVPLTNGTVAGLPRIVAMKRTSLKLRSPANAPDAADKLVLDHIQQLLDDGDPPPPLLVQRVEPTGAAPEWRVYKPIGMMPKCLACHGDPEGQPDALRAKLAERYPEDQATGYNTGEWRGLIRVTVADAPKK